jgi:hypothetical protein
MIPLMAAIFAGLIVALGNGKASGVVSPGSLGAPAMGAQCYVRLWLLLHADPTMGARKPMLTQGVLAPHPAMSGALGLFPELGGLLPGGGGFRLAVTLWPRAQQPAPDRGEGVRGRA